MRVLRKGTISDLDNPLAYLQRSIVNLASNQRRSLGRRRKAVARLPVEESWLPSYPADIEAILDLPPKQRAILYLVEVEGVPYAEAADQLGMTTMAARAMANRARNRLGSQWRWPVADFKSKLQQLSERGTPVGVEELIERIEAELAGDPLVVATKRREGVFMTKTDQPVTTKSPGPGRGLAWAVAAFAVILATGGLYFAFRGDDGQMVDQTTLPTPTTIPASVSGSMWPQSSLEEVEEAQELADAGDPDYTWQLDPEIANGNVQNPEIVTRFLREELGWEEFIFNAHVGWETANTNLHYVKCAPGGTNPVYPDDEYAGKCAPTIDEFQYETVTIDLAQPIRSDGTGIWVVNRWRQAAPFAEADPVAVEARLTERLEEFLAARIAGQGAELRVLVDPDLDVPLLYATTSGAPYERYEIERVDGPGWPDARMTFSVRLFADGDATVVEQEVDGSQTGELWLDGYSTVENGQPIQLSHTSFDGEVTVSAPSTWKPAWPGAAHIAEVGVWWGGLWRTEDFVETGERGRIRRPGRLRRVVRSERRVPAALGASRCSGNCAASHLRPQLRDNSAGGRARRWPRRRVDRRGPCPWWRGLRHRND